MSDEPRPALPPSVARPLAIAREWITGLSRPARVLLASTVLAAAVLTGWVVWSSRVETWGVLYSQLERDDAAALVTKLKELKVPYRLQGDGNVVEVPEARVHELRLELASAGLPRGGGVGFEAFDRMRLGATEFEQRVLFRRALEGELARTVGSLGAVQSARVHLVMPERSVFLSRNDPASASVVVRMRPGRRLGSPEVSGIVHLIASSVPSLDADRITLVTTEGEMLHRPRGEGADANNEEDRSAQHRAIESDLEERTRAMLERVVGEGHVDVRASVELDLARVERTEDTYNRDSAALRSEEQSLEHVGPATAPTMAGVPGAESNLGGAAATVTPAGRADGGVIREQHTRNYEIDHVREHRVATQASIKRITVAVVLDGVTIYENGRPRVAPRPAEEVERIRALVRGAVGANDDRGDAVTVSSIPFQETLAAPAAASRAARAVARPARPTRLYIGAAVAVALVLLIVAVSAARRRARKPEVVTETPPLAALPAEEDVVPLDPETARERLRAEVHARVLADPASAALVLRAWLGTESPERQTRAS